MLTGADLIRNSHAQTVRAERVIKASPTASADHEQETTGGLLRFARFINSEKSKKRKTAHPYKDEPRAALGRHLDIYI